MRASSDQGPGPASKRNIEVVKANRTEIETELRKLPKTESDDLLSSVRIAVDADKNGSDTEPEN